MSRVYVGNLPADIRQRDVEDLFFKYGRVVEIDLKHPQRPPAFAFVTFDRFQDAEDAVRGRDGVEYEGLRLRVEVSRNDGPAGGGGRGALRGNDFGGRGGGGYRAGGSGDRFPDRGFPDRGFPDRGFPDRGFPDRGFPDRGYSDRGFNDRGFPERGFPGHRGGYDRGFMSGGFPDRGFPDRGRFPPRGGMRGGGRGGGAGGGGGKRTEHRIMIDGLPLTASWQDLKDFFREVGEVVYSDVDQKGGGIIEFTSARHQDAAIKRFDNTDWKNPRSYIADTGLIRVKKPAQQKSADGGGASRNGDGDKGEEKRGKRGKGSRASASRSASRSRSRSQRRGKSRSRSRSAARSEAKSEARSEAKEEKAEKPLNPKP